jgi:hypothetical protein
MKKRPVFLGAILVLLSFTLNFYAFAATQENKLWNIDKFMQFQIAYLPDKKIEVQCDICNTQTPLLAPNNAFDITNINLADFLNLGFDVQNTEDPKNYNLYLKLYKFPVLLNHMQTIAEFTKDFAIDKLPQANYIEKYITNRNNLQIKYALIDKSNAIFNEKNPIPQFKINYNNDFITYFNSHIPFYSLYLVPNQVKPKFTSEDDIANFSTLGVTGFYHELLNGYRKNLMELSGDDNKYYYFTDKNTASNAKILVVLKVPKTPLEFKNWRDLPMPQNPKSIFLTSLLLVYHTEYSVKDSTLPEKIPPINSPAFQNLFAKTGTKVLEVGSVVYLNK